MSLLLSAPMSKPNLPARSKPPRGRRGSTCFIFCRGRRSSILDRAASWPRRARRRKARPNADISVVGHADATGSDAYNQALSLRRAQIVRDGLVAAGAPSEVVEIGYHGPNNPLVPKPRGVPELRNRRVEVTIR
ncbi:MAG: OmpA family protein [Alphaproteobacteria bacterium]|nr:OmpA family protein [Alphaproteobacteria bacterium]